MAYNRFRLAAVAAMVGATMLSTRAHAANLVVNGSFEDTTNFAPDANDTDSLPVGSTAMPGWTVTGDTLAWIGPTNTFGLSASDGQYFLDLTGYEDAPPYAGVLQTTIATTPGGRYLLTFDLGSSTTFGVPDSVTATVGSASQLFTSTLTGTNNWEHESLAFTAAGPTTTVSLQGFSGQKYIGLDNVSVTSVPEPATWAMLILGLGMVGFAARRRREGMAVAA